MEPNCAAQRASPVNEINLHLFAIIFAHSTLIAWGEISKLITLQTNQLFIIQLLHCSILVTFVNPNKVQKYDANDLYPS